jgi:hypothetical protein
MVIASLAFLSAGLAVFQVLPVDAARRRFQADPIATEELESFASCTWPLDLIALPSDAPSPKGDLFALDDTTMLALVLVFALGFSAMRAYFSEFAEEERLKQKMGKVLIKKDEVPTKIDEDSASNQSWPLERLPTACVIILLSMVATASMATIDHAHVPCTRTPPHAPPGRATLSALNYQDPMASLMQLPGMDQVDTACDALTAAFMLTCVLIGTVMMRVDLDEFLAEQESKPPRTSPTHEEHPEDAPTSSSRRGGKRFSRRTFFYIALTMMVVLAMMAAQEKSALPAMSVYDTDELKVLSEGLGHIQDEFSGHGLSDGIVALLVSIIAAVGCKVCHFSDLLDAKAEEEDRNPQAEKKTKKSLSSEAVKTKTVKAA